LKALVFLFGILISSASYANLFAQSESDNSFFNVESRLKVESDTQFGASELLETGRFSETDTSSQTSGSKKLVATQRTSGCGINRHHQSHSKHIQIRKKHGVYH